MNKTKIIAIVCCICLIATSVSVLVGCDKEKDKTEAQVATTYVSMDINPTVELVVDQNNKVMSVHAANEDAEVMLYAEEGIVNASVSDASGKILDLAVQYGYLDEDNSTVEVAVATDKDGADETVQNAISAQITAKSESVDFNLSVSFEDTFGIQRKLEEYKEKYPNLTGAKLKLMLSAMACDPTLTFDDAYAMSVEDLLEIVEDKENQLTAYCDAGYQKAVAAANILYAQSVDVAKATAFSVQYSKYALTSLTLAAKASEITAYPVLVAADYALQNAIVAYEYVGAIEVSEETVNAVAEELGLTDEQKEAMKNDDGIYTIESIEAYINKLVKNATAEEKAKIDAKRDEIVATLNSEEATITASLEVTLGNAIHAAVNVEISGKTLAEYLANINIEIPEEITIEDVKELQNKVSEAAVSTHDSLYNALSDDQKTEIDATVQKVDDKAAEYKETLDSSIATAKSKIETKIAAKKEARKESVKAEA